MSRRANRRAAVDYDPNPSAIPFHESPARVKALMGPVGSGKSLAWMMHAAMKASLLDVPLRSIVIRQSWPELRDSTKVTWDRALGAISDWKGGDKQMQFTLPNARGNPLTHTLDFRHARNANDASRFLSTEYGLIVLEECVPAFDVGRGIIGGGIPEEIFNVAIMRLRQPEVPNPELLCVFNPPNKRHWTYRLFVGPSKTEKGRAELARKSYGFFDQPPFENKKNLPDGYYEHLLETLSPELADRFVRGLPVTIYPGMPVYGDILEDYHVVDQWLPVLPGLPICTCHDFGRTPAILFYQVTPAGQMRFLLEIQMWGASTKAAVERMDRTLRDEFPKVQWARGFADPAGQNPTEVDDRTSFMIFAAAGYRLQPGAEGVATRIETVKQRAARTVGREPALLISARGCPMLAEAVLGGYRYPKTGDQVGWQPLKNDYSHIANAFEYGVTGEFGAVTGERKRDDRHQDAGRLIPRFSPLSSPRRDDGGWMSS